MVAEFHGVGDARGAFPAGRGSGAVGLVRRDRPKVHWASPDTGPGIGPQRQQAEGSLRNGFSPLGGRLLLGSFWVLLSALRMAVHRFGIRAASCTHFPQGGVLRFLVMNDAE